MEKKAVEKDGVPDADGGGEGVPEVTCQSECEGPSASPGCPLHGLVLEV